MRSVRSPRDPLHPLMRPRLSSLVSFFALLALPARARSFDTGFVCPDTQGAALDCQFGEDLSAFADALESLCAIVRAEGLACSAPLANIELFPAVRLARYGAAHTPRGLIDWFELLAPRAPSMDILSADLTPSNTSATPALDISWQQLGAMALTPARPFVVASYGADAYNSSAWYAKAGAPFDATYPSLLAASTVDTIGTYALASIDGHVADAEDEPSQASWLVALATELEAHFVGCGDASAMAPVAGVLCDVTPNVVGSGGVLRSFRDEWWRATSPAEQVWYGGVASFCDTDPTCVAMRQLCPLTCPTSYAPT